MKFETRTTAHSPVFAGSYEIGGPIENMWEPAAGNTVALHSGAVTVLVRITTASNRQYEGEIVGFERHTEYEYQGRRPGDAVAFSYENIFGCSR